ECAPRAAQDVIDVATPFTFVAVEDEPAAILEAVKLFADPSLGAAADEPVRRVVAAPFEFAEQHEAKTCDPEIRQDGCAGLWADVVLDDEERVDGRTVDHPQQQEPCDSDATAQCRVVPRPVVTLLDFDSRQHPEHVRRKERVTKLADVAEPEGEAE